MTMKNLFQIWRKFSLLSEGMKLPKDLPEKVYVTILDQEPDVYFYYSNKNGGKLPKGYEVYGSVMITKTSKNLDGNCYNGMVVVMTTDTTKGWGPLLYDLALEYASQNSNGLMSDRETVTSEAVAVWEKYLDTRSDVKKIQMDNMENELTPNEEDNCNQTSAEEWAEEEGGSWSDSPLSKIYKKQNPTMTNELQSINKLLRMQ